MNGVGLYQETAVSTQNKGRLIVMLYDGAIKFLKCAIRDIENSDFASKARNISKAQDIISELNTILDMEVGGEIASNLRSLYNFMNGHLVQASNKADVGMIKEVISLLEELNAGWKVVAG